MATVELKRSRSTSRGGNERITRNYDIVGSDDDAVAEADLLATIPSSYRGLPRSDYTMEWVAQGVYTAEVTYQLVTSPQNQQESNNVGSTTGQVSLTIGGETVHRTTSEETVGTYPAGAPSYDKAIGVRLDGGQWDVEGCDVMVPTIMLRETHYFTPSSLTEAYRNTVEDLAGTVNNATFKGRAAGEVRFDGAEFSLSDGEKVVATYTFSIQKNKTGLTIGSVTDIDKDGWDFLWVKYKSDVDTGEIVTTAEAVYVERVYPREDFSALQIGT